MNDDAADEVQLELFELKQAPRTMYYIPDYVNECEESLLLSEIAERTPKPKWRTLNNRRCINYGGIVGRSALIRCDDTPAWLVRLMARVDSTLKARTLPGALNHCLINEYTPGQGIMPHHDGPAYYPVVATLSIGADISLDFHADSDTGGARTHVGSVYLRRRSLLVLADDAYTHLMHGIDPRTYDIIDEHTFNRLADASAPASLPIERIETRYSLTMRHVCRVNESLMRFVHPQS